MVEFHRNSYPVGNTVCLCLTFLCIDLWRMCWLRVPGIYLYNHSVVNGYIDSIIQLYIYSEITIITKRISCTYSKGYVFTASVFFLLSKMTSDGVMTKLSLPGLQTTNLFSSKLFLFFGKRNAIYY